jgi:hypothetical protein
MSVRTKFCLRGVRLFGVLTILGFAFLGQPSSAFADGSCEGWELLTCSSASACSNVEENSCNWSNPRCEGAVFCTSHPECDGDPLYPVATMCGFVPE